MTQSESERDNNAIQKLLSAAGVPWLLPRYALTSRYEIKRHPAYDHDVIEIPTPNPLVKNLLWPLSAQVSERFSHHLPATYFSSETSFSKNARDNLQRTARELEAMLGSARITQQYNTESCEWVSGNASLRLKVWPLDLQFEPTSDNPSHEREPRLITACHIAIDTGFRLSATDTELAWINSFVPISPIHFTSIPANEYDLEYVREPVAAFDAIAGHVGVSKEGGALILGQSQLYIVPMVDVMRFDVQRMTPAKGGGGSWLSVECRTQCPGIAHKSLHISQAPGADDLNDFAAALARLTKKPFKLGDYQPDC